MIAIRSSKAFWVLVCLTVLCQPAVAQMATAAPQPVVVRAARMLDVESGRMLTNVRIVIEGDRIQSVNPATVPSGARTIDLGDVTLMPGFIDMHTHLSGEIG